MTEEKTYNYAGVELVSNKELLEFCDDVRRAGGGKPLNALLPGVPSDAQTCLIARNLNFECSVQPIPAEEIYVDEMYDEELNIITSGYGWNDVWGMLIRDESTRNSISDELCLIPFDYDDDAWNDQTATWDRTVSYGVILPASIGFCAKAFDNTFSPKGIPMNNEYLDKFKGLAVEKIVDSVS